MAAKTAATSPAPDISEILALDKSRSKRMCQVALAKEGLDLEDSEKLDAAIVAIGRGIVSSTAIVEWLKLRKLTVSVNAITSHRKGTCTCG